MVDNFKSGFLAADYFIRKGHRNIRLLSGSPRSSTFRQVQNGFTHALNKAGIEVTDDTVTNSDYTWMFGYRFAKELAENQNGATAIFIVSYTMAVGFERGWNESGKTIPGDISVICFDAIPSVNLTPIGFTTIASDPVSLGARAAKTLLERMEDYETPVKDIKCAPVILERESVAELNTAIYAGKE